MRVFSLLFWSLVLIIALVNPALAQDAAAAGANWNGLAAGLGIAIAAFGGAIGQGRAASAALEGIGRNPGASGQMFTPMLLGLVFIESLVIYALIISFNLL